jgi:hypothetical protein
VTSMRVRLHHADQFLTGFIVFPWSEANTVLPGLAEILSSAPDELSVVASEPGFGGGAPVLSLRPTWTGAPAEGET